ncbi:MAG: CAP domain-containing protein [Rhodobacteraceae bacterium]|nr:CAP domain-containing protein [Paracoccaceae bacterium]
MPTAYRIIATLFLFVLFTPMAIAACTPAPFSSRQNAVIPTKSPDQSLFTTALNWALAPHRCKAGRTKFATDADLIKTAAIHSRNMARLRRFSHRLKVPGQKTVTDRAKKTGVKWKFIAENIARLSRYQFRPNTKFGIVDAKNCQFSDRKTGARIPPHTYASLANSVAAQWLASSGHRKNILNRKSRRMGAAIAFDAQGAHCGHFYITQVFSD